MEVGRVELPSVPFPAVDCVQVCAWKNGEPFFETKCPIVSLPSSDIAGAKARRYNTGTRPNEREPNRCPDCGKAGIGKNHSLRESHCWRASEGFKQVCTYLSARQVIKRGVVRLPPDPQRLKVRRNPSPPYVSLIAPCVFHATSRALHPCAVLSRAYRAVFCARRAL